MDKDRIRSVSEGKEAKFLSPTFEPIPRTRSKPNYTFAPQLYAKNGDSSKSVDTSSHPATAVAGYGITRSARADRPHRRRAVAQGRSTRFQPPCSKERIFRPLEKCQPIFLENPTIPQNASFHEGRGEGLTILTSRWRFAATTGIIPPVTCHLLPVTCYLSTFHLSTCYLLPVNLSPVNLSPITYHSSSIHLARGGSR